MSTGMPPTAFVPSLIGTIVEHMFEVTGMSTDDLIAALRKTERVIAAANAEQIALIAAVHARTPRWLTATDPGSHPVHLSR